MHPQTERRLWLGLGAATVALGAALALRFVLEGIRPSDEFPAASRYRAAAVTVVAAGAAGAVAAGLALFGSVASPIPAVLGAAAAYAGGRAVRSWMLDPATESVAAAEADEEAEGRSVETPTHDP